MFHTVNNLKYEFIILLVIIFLFLACDNMYRNELYKKILCFVFWFICLVLFISWVWLNIKL